MSLTIKEIMSAPVTSCTMDANVGKVRDLLKLKGFSALPVVTVSDDDIQVEGIVTYRDIAGVYDDNVPVTQVMTQRIKIVEPDTDVQGAAHYMSGAEIHHLVVKEEGRIVGMVSSADYVAIVAKYGLADKTV